MDSLKGLEGNVNLLLAVSILYFDRNCGGVSVTWRLPPIIGHKVGLL